MGHPLTKKVLIELCTAQEKLIKQLRQENDSLGRSKEFYSVRMDALQTFQMWLPEPYRTALCDIIANGTVRTWPLPPASAAPGKFEVYEALTIQALRMRNEVFHGGGMTRDTFDGVYLNGIGEYEKQLAKREGIRLETA